MKPNINEQTNSSIISDTIISRSSIPIHNYENEDLEKSNAKKSRHQSFKIKAYHPKMMIFYRNLKLKH